MKLDPKTLNAMDDVPAKRPHATPFAEIAAARMNRRTLLGGVAAASLTAFVGPTRAELYLDRPALPGLVVDGLSPDLKVAKGLTFDVIARLGDPVLPGAPQFDPENRSAAAQALQFGDGADYTAFRSTVHAQTRGLLAVNHEFALPLITETGEDQRDIVNTAEMTALTQNAMGMSVVEIAKIKNSGAWQRTEAGHRNRRITAAGTPCRMAGPAAGHARLRTKDNADGNLAYGTMGNCAGGVTPWGTVLTAEENIQFFFQGDPAKTGREHEAYARYGIDGKGPWPWGQHDGRFNLEETPNAANLVGWIVEIDLFNPAAPPIKHTALGRFKHEGAGCTTTPDGRVVVYMGDDQNFEYLYRYVSKGQVNSKAHAMINSRLLDEGTLAVAEFTEEEVIWHDLVYGEGPLTEKNGFASQADVVIEARRAADLMGATPMDRPEDVEVHPRTGFVYAMLTNNIDRGYFDTNAANPRGPNMPGHVIEMMPPQDSKGMRDHAASRFAWNMFLKGGPTGGFLMTILGQKGRYGNGIKDDQWLAAPDNCTFTQSGQLLIATDGMEHADMPDGLFLMETDGPGRAVPRRLMAAPIGSEVTGPTFAAQDTTLFCSIQHPGMGSPLANPNTRFPDYDPALPPRSSVIALRREDGGKIS